MTKRILTVFLAALVLVTFVPLSAQAAQEQSGAKHTVSLTSNLNGKATGVGDTVSLKVLVSGNEDTVTAYNAYDLKLSYDADHLNFLSAAAADDDAEITAENDRIRVKGYGADKNVSVPAVILNFQAKKPGNTTVTLFHAKVDLSDNAGYNNAPEVPIVATAASVTVPIEGFEVEVEGEGVKVAGDMYVAVSGEDFVFSLEDYELYDYEVGVTIDGVEITSAVRINRKTGTYTIPQKEIDGKIRITAKRVPKTFTVTVTGSDIAGEKTAEYNTDYTFALEREEGYLYTVKVTINRQEYTGYSVEEDTYTIPGADITGNIRIRVIKYEDDSNKVRVTFAGAGARDGKGAKKTLRGVEYPFKVNKRKGYTYSVTVYVDGKRTAYDYDANLDMYYILSDHVRGNIVIVIGKVATVEVSEYITLDGQSMFLIVYNGIVNEGQVPKYDGRSMYWSDPYKAYAWLVVSGDSEKKVKRAAEENITLNEGTAAGDIDYSGNVNRSLQTDLADAQLAWEMYEGKHSLDFMEMQKLLSADVHPDKKVNVRDVAAIVKKIS